MDPSAERASAYLTLLQNDLKFLSAETKKKYAGVKSAADHALILLSNPNLSRNCDNLYNLLQSDDSIWRPFLCAVESGNNERVIAVGLSYLHHLLAPRSSKPEGADIPGLSLDNGGVITNHLVEFTEACKDDALTQKALQGLLALLPAITSGHTAASLPVAVLRVCLHAACARNTDLAHSGASAAKQIVTYALNKALAAIAVPPCAAAAAVGVCSCSLQELPPDTTGVDADLNLISQLMVEVLSHVHHAVAHQSAHNIAAAVPAIANRKPPPAHVIGHPALRGLLLELLAATVGPQHPAMAANRRVAHLVAAAVPAACVALCATSPTPTAAALVSDPLVVGRGLRTAAAAVRIFAGAVAAASAAQIAATIHEVAGPDAPLPLPSWTGFPVAAASSGSGSNSRADGGAATAAAYGARVAALFAWRDWAASPSFLLRLHSGRALRGVTRAVARLCARTLAVCDSRDSRAWEMERHERAARHGGKAADASRTTGRSRAVVDVSAAANATAVTACQTAYDCLLAIVAGAAAVPKEARGEVLEDLWAVAAEPIDAAVAAVFADGEGPDVAQPALRTLQQLIHGCCVEGLDVGRDALLTRLSGICFVDAADARRPLTDSMRPAQRVNVAAAKTLFTVVTALGDHLQGAWLTVVATLRALSARLSDRSTDTDSDLLRALLANVFVASRFMSDDAVVHLARALVAVIADASVRPSTVAAPTTHPFGVDELFAVLRANTHRLSVFAGALRDATSGPSAALYGPTAPHTVREAAARAFTDLVVSLAVASHDTIEAAAAGAPAPPLTPTTAAASGMESLTVPQALRAQGDVVMLLELHELLAVSARSDHSQVPLGELVASMEVIVERAGDALPRAAWRVVLSTLAAAAAVAVGERRGRGAGAAAPTASRGVDELLAARILRTAELIASNHLPVMGAAAVVRCVDLIGAFVALRGRVGIRSALLAIRLLLEIADGAAASAVDTAQDPDVIESDATASQQQSQPAQPAQRVLVADVWVAILRALAHGSADERPEVRDAALKTLATVAVAHGADIPLEVWRASVWPSLLDAVDAIESSAQAASHAPRSGGGGGTDGAHLQGETEWRQWQESHATALDAIARIAVTRGRLFVQHSDTVRAPQQPAVVSPPPAPAVRTVSDDELAIATAAAVAAAAVAAAGPSGGTGGLQSGHVERAMSAGVALARTAVPVGTAAPTIARSSSGTSAGGPVAISRRSSLPPDHATYRTHVRVADHIIRAMASPCEALRVAALTAAARLAVALAAVAAPTDAPFGGASSAAAPAQRVSATLCDVVWTAISALTAPADAPPVSVRSMREPPRVVLTAQSLGKGRSVAHGAKALAFGSDAAATVALLPWPLLASSATPAARAVGVMAFVRDIADAPETHDTFVHPPPQLVAAAAAAIVFATAFTTTPAPFQSVAVCGGTPSTSASDSGLLAAPAAFAGAVAPGAMPSPWVGAIPAALTCPFVVQPADAAAAADIVWRRALSALLARVPDVALVERLITESDVATYAALDAHLRAVAHPQTAAFVLRAALDLVTHPCAPLSFRSDACVALCEALHSALLTRFVGDARYGVWCHAISILRALAHSVTANVAIAMHDPGVRVPPTAAAWSPTFGYVAWGGGWDMSAAELERILDALHVSLSAFVLRSRSPPPQAPAHDPAVRLSPLNSEVGHAAADAVALQVLVETLSRLPRWAPKRVTVLLSSTLADAAAVPALCVGAISAIIAPFAAAGVSGVAAPAQRGADGSAEVAALAGRIAPASAVSIPSFPRVNAIFEEDAAVAPGTGFVATPEGTVDGAARVRAQLAPHLVVRAIAEVRAAVGALQDARDGAHTVSPRSTTDGAVGASPASPTGPAESGPTKPFNPLAAHVSDSEGDDDKIDTVAAVGMPLAPLLRALARVHVVGDDAHAAAVAAIARCAVQLPTRDACPAVYGSGVITLAMAAVSAPLVAHPDPDVRAATAALITASFADLGLHDTQAAAGGVMSDAGTPTT